MEKFTGIPCKEINTPAPIPVQPCHAPWVLGKPLVQHSGAFPKIIKSFRLEKAFKIEFNSELNAAEFPSKQHTFCVGDFGLSRVFLPLVGLRFRRDQRGLLQGFMED